jgi:hypothetical protein
MLQAPPAWTNLVPIPMQRLILFFILVGRQQLTSGQRKEESIVEPHTFSHIFSN